MATVSRATDLVLGRTVAVKILTDQLAADDRFLARFRREARSVASLNHPNIVSIFDTGEDGDTHFIVMEYVEGRTVAELLDVESPFAVDRAVAITAAVARALQAAHERGVIHRDVKPGNIMLTPNGLVKVMDFGIARASGDEAHTGFILGSASYLSPEQAAGDAIDGRCDLYSLGCVLYEMLTGRPPFNGDSPLAVAYKHLHEEPLPPSRLRSGVTPQLDGVVVRAMAKAPARRFGSAAEMGDALMRPRQSDRVDDAQTVAMPTLTKGVLGPPATPNTGAKSLWAAPRLPIALVGVALVFWLLVSFLATPTQAPTVTERSTPSAPAPQQTSPPRQSSVSEAAAEVRGLVSAGLSARDLSSRAANEVLEHVDEAMEKLAEGKASDALKKLGEARSKLIESEEKREVAPARATAIREALDDLRAALEQRL
jgi:serine/threonine protein kinase